jgi:hypothetical protein
MSFSTFRFTRPQLRLSRALATAFLMVAGGASSAQAATYTVDRSDDSDTTACTATANDCSLRGAINRANGDNEASDIVFDAAVFNAPRKTITIGAQLPDLAANGALTITAPPAGVTISGGSAFRIFRVSPAISTLGGANVSLVGLHIIDGNVGLSSGAAILNFGTLLVDRCTITGHSGGTGAAIYSDTDLSGKTFTVRNSTFSNNTAGQRRARRGDLQQRWAHRDRKLHHRRQLGGHRRQRRVRAGQHQHPRRSSQLHYRGQYGHRCGLRRPQRS